MTMKKRIMTVNGKDNRNGYKTFYYFKYYYLLILRVRIPSNSYTLLCIIEPVMFAFFLFPSYSTNANRVIHLSSCGIFYFYNRKHIYIEFLLIDTNLLTNVLNSFYFNTNCHFFYNCSFHMSCYTLEYFDQQSD